MAGEIFISYRRADRVWATRLHELLRAEGVEAWYDAHVAAGEDWRLATAQALEDSRIFVLLFSAQAAASSDIAKELAAAVLEKKLIVPVRLENIAPKGAFLYELASRNWINAYDDTEARLAELAKGLAQMVRTGARDESLLPFERAEQGKARRSRMRLFFAAAASLAVIAAAVAGWWFWPAQHWTVESSRAFISTMALEGEPAFSPDGKMLAYTSGADPGSRKIYARNLAGGSAIKITNDTYADVSPTWSSDGSRVAYVAVKPGEPCRIMVATVPAGEARQVGRCAENEASTVSWQPGTSFLYYIDRRGDAGSFIFRLDLESGTLTKLNTSSVRILVGLRHLQCSPDGKSLLWIWGETASTDALVTYDLASEKAKPLARMVGGGSAAWSEDSRAVLTSRGSGIGSEITAYPLDGAKPYSLYTTTINASHLAAGKGGLLAVETDASRQNLARILPNQAVQPDIIEAVNGKTWAPTFAPDGTLAFLSNRSGTNAIWVMKPGAAPSVLYDAGLTPLFRLEYSPDGNKLALVIARENGLTIKILSADGSPVTSFDTVTLGYGNPTWTPDGKAVTAYDRAGGQTVRIAIDNPAQRTRLTVAPPWAAVTVRSDGLYAVKFGTGGLYKIGTTPALVGPKYPVEFTPPITFLHDDLLVPDFDAAGGARILAQPLAGGADRVLGYAPGAEAQDRFFETKMRANPKTGDVIYVAAVQGDTNIDLLTLARH